ncbi:MAG: hypothetical protein P1P88_13460 [Bacteroidales bacterium]|nr:hypothetical protein [Bacteroidales bacterium]
MIVYQIHEKLLALPSYILITFWISIINIKPSMPLQDMEDDFEKAIKTAFESCTNARI